MKSYQQETKYSVLWALSVVKMLKKKHARAAGSTQQFYSLSDEKIAMWLAIGSRRWTHYREFVKTVERWVIQQKKCKDDDPRCGDLSYYDAVKTLDMVFRRKYR